MISIIIPTYNHLEDCLKPCVESIRKYTNEDDVEIIIVVNGCTDGTKEYVESLPAPFKLLWFDEPLGYAKANNEALKIAKGDYIVLLNNDTILLEQERNAWLDMLQEPMSEKVGITGPLIGYSNEAGYEFAVFFCAMIKKEVFDEIGLLDEVFGVGGGEDTDFCVRATNAGWLIEKVPGNTEWNGELIVGGFPIYHKGEATVSENPEWDNIFKHNGEILRQKYNIQWKLGNVYERAVFKKDDDISKYPREFVRYTWARENMVGNKVLEIGCSSGYGVKFMPDGVDYTGYDYCQEVLDYAKEQFPAGEYKQFDLEKQKIVGQWDTIIAFEVLEHLENGKELAQELKKHCKVLLVTTPYKEPKGMWGGHHKLHNLSEEDFPGFEYTYMNLDGKLSSTVDETIRNVVDGVERTEGLILMKCVS